MYEHLRDADPLDPGLVGKACRFRGEFWRHGGANLMHFDNLLIRKED